MTRVDCCVCRASSGARLAIVTHASRFDEIAPIYDETRGGEARGDEYAADIDRLLPPSLAPS